ncbi:MAG: hypothetical protein JSW51_11390 [Gemmatimonadota bacterium]|nr:MAG: hypothetical protein JSW51_11390 [Gemmatimonadota bacterium]
MRGPPLRRLLHVGSAVVLLIPLWASWDLLRLALGILAAIAVALDLARIGLPNVGRRIVEMVPVFRDMEARRLSGATWLSLGYALSAWFPPIAPAAGILVSASADPAASMVGGLSADSVGKTVIGSLAALGTSVVVLTLLGLPWQAVVVGAVIGTALERWPGPCDDNLVVAPGVACVVWLLT